MDYLELMQYAGPLMARGAGLTLMFALASMAGGLLLAILLVAARLVRVPMLRRLAAAYVSLMRGTPLLVQVFVVYYGLPSAGLEMSAVTAGILALSLNAGAYLSESLRGAIAGVTRGQWEAGSSLGLTYWQCFRHVVFPQALRVAVPGMSNTLISLIKDTSLVSVITVAELMLATREAIATTFRPLPLYLAAALVYWCFSLVFELLQHWLERRLGRSVARDGSERTAAQGRTTQL